MIEFFGSIAMIAFIVERIVKYLFNIKLLKKIDNITSWISLKVWSSMVIGITIAYQSKLDFVEVILGQESGSMIGVILTGILISGGSNLINQIINKFMPTNKGI